MKTTDLPKAITIVADSLTIATNVFGRGDVVEVTDDLLEATTDRDGKTFLAMADDEREQVRVYGRRMFLPGDHGAAIRAHDAKAAAAREALRKAQADRNGLAALRDVYAEEEALRAAPYSSRSKTTAGCS